MKKPKAAIHDRRVYAAGYVLAWPSCAVDSLFVICWGRVRVETPKGGGVVGPGHVIGLDEILDDPYSPRFDLIAEAIGPVDAIRLEAAGIAREIAGLSAEMRLTLRAMSRAGVDCLQGLAGSEQAKEAKLRRAERSLPLVMEACPQAEAALAHDIRADGGFGFLP